MPENDETQPSPADNAGQSPGGPPASEGRPVAEGPATDGGTQAGQNPAGSPPPGSESPPGGYGPPTGHTRPPRLTRRAHGQDRVVGGVAGGIADYFGVDPLLVRLAFAGFALIGGGGIVLYVLGWIFIPERGEGEIARKASRFDRFDAGKYLGLGLIAIATLIFIDGIGFGPEGLGFFEHLFFATILVGLGVYLLRRESVPVQSAAQPPPPPQAPPPGPPVPDATTSRMVATEQAQPIPSATYPQSSIGYEPLEEPKKPRERSSLGLFTLAAVLLATGAAALLNNLEVTSFDGGQLSALALMVLGGGLIVGAWWGRARWLIWIGVLMFPFVALFSLIDLSMVPFEGEVGQLNERPLNQIEIAGGYELLVGEARIDMSDFEFVVDDEAELAVDMAAGQVIVTVPRDVYVDADISLEAGEIMFFDNRRAGQGVEIADSDGDSTSDARLSLEIEGVFGQVEIERSPDRALIEGTTSEEEEPRNRQRRERERPR